MKVVRLLGIGSNICLFKKPLNTNDGLVYKPSSIYDSCIDLKTDNDNTTLWYSNLDFIKSYFIS